MLLPATSYPFPKHAHIILTTSDSSVVRTEMSAGSSSSGRTKDFVMSQRKTRDVSKLIKDLEKLVSRHMKEREDRKLKGLLLYLKGNVLRNSVHAEHFRTEGGVSLLCTLLQKYSSIRDSVIATVMSLLANLTALDGKTKQEVSHTIIC